VELALIGVNSTAHVDILPAAHVVLNFDFRIEIAYGGRGPLDLSVTAFEADNTLISYGGFSHVYGDRLRLIKSATINGSQLEEIGASIL